MSPAIHVGHTGQSDGGGDDGGDDVGDGVGGVGDGDQGIYIKHIQPTIYVIHQGNIKFTECFKNKSFKRFVFLKNSTQPLILGGSSFRTLPRQPPEATKLG